MSATNEKHRSVKLCKRALIPVIIIIIIIHPLLCKFYYHTSNGKSCVFSHMSKTLKWWWLHCDWLHSLESPGQYGMDFGIHVGVLYLLQRPMTENKSKSFAQN